MRAQALSTTSYQNGWTVADTSSAGTPTYLVAGSGSGMTLTCDNTNEAQIITMYTGDVLPYNILDLSNLWWVAKVSGIDSATTLTMGLGSARNDTADTVTTNAYFRIDGGTSTSALDYESDDGTTDDDDKSTGTTLASTYKRLLVDFTQGMSTVRFFVDGSLVGTTSMAALTRATYVQPLAMIQKSGGTGIPAVSFGQFGVTYKWSYGA